MRSSPDLIAARSMLYSLALNATESERWYAVLQEYAADHPDPEEHRLAESWLVYLDISLPHRAAPTSSRYWTRLPGRSKPSVW